MPRLTHLVVVRGLQHERARGVEAQAEEGVSMAHLEVRGGVVREPACSITTQAGRQTGRQGGSAGG